jgi:hypothetical protein
MAEILDINKSLNEGAILLTGLGVDSWHWKLFVESGYFDPNKKIADYSKEDMEKFLNSPAHKIKVIQY